MDTTYPHPNQITIWGGTAGHPFTTTGGTGSTFNLDDTSTYALGDRSIKITTNGTNQNTFVRKLNGTAMDFTDRVPVVWFKVDDHTHLLDCELWLGSGGGLANAYKWNLAGLGSQYVGDDEWVVASLPWSKATVVGTPNRAALTDVNWQVFDGSAGVLNMWWGGLASEPDTTVDFPNGLVTFTFDDGYASTRTIAAPYLQSAGHQGTCFVINDVIDTANYMTTAQLQELQDTYGFEIGLHSATSADHNAVGGLTSLSADELVANMQTNRAFLASKGIKYPTSLGYPQGIFDADTVETLRTLVTSARTTDLSTLETVPPGDRLKIHAKAVDASVSVATVTALIDQAKANNEWLVLLFHDIVAAGATGPQVLTADFEAIVDYVGTASVSTATFSEAAGTPGKSGDTLKDSLNRLVGTTGLDEKLAANLYAGTTGLDTKGALNVKAGTSGFDLNLVLNILAGTTGLGTQEAARQITN